MATGRDELLAANVARARANVNNPSNSLPQDNGQSPLGSVASPASSRNLLGANLDVLEALDTIEFSPGLGDLSMRGSVAYIRFWQRGNAPQQTQVQVEAPQGGGGGGASAFDIKDYDFTALRAFDFSNAYLTDLSRIGLFGSGSGPEVSYFSDIDVITDEGETITSGRVTFFSQSDEKKKALSSSVPTTSDTENAQSGSRGSGTVAQNINVRESVTTSSGPVTGRLKSANPSGLVNSFLASNRRPATPYAGSLNSTPVYLGKSKGTVGSASSLMSPTQPGMWQFLFNPSELELEAGPEYMTAETWGVSDKGNSGQPLHWSHNKNAKLKFNSILLNGYVFGRKVEALEQGLLELFMYRDGAGQDGPPVLEFVWGKRSFGPCVIKDINVKEKQWDEGEVVNAELSFTLEQVPEWVVNDGFVDVARPGRQPINVDQVSTGTEQPATGPGGGTQEQTPPPPVGGGDSQDQKGREPNSPQPDFKAIAKKCVNLENLISNLRTIQQSPNFLGISQQNPAQAQDRLRKYSSMYAEARRQAVAPINVGRSFSPKDIERQINKIWDDNSRGQTRPGRLQSRYPFQQANALIASGVSFLIGTLTTQTKSSTCTRAKTESSKSRGTDF